MHHSLCTGARQASSLTTERRLVQRWDSCPAFDFLFLRSLRRRGWVGVITMGTTQAGRAWPSQSACEWPSADAHLQKTWDGNLACWAPDGERRVIHLFSHYCIYLFSSLEKTNNRGRSYRLVVLLTPPLPERPTSSPSMAPLAPQLIELPLLLAAFGFSASMMGLGGADYHDFMSIRAKMQSSSFRGFVNLEDNGILTVDLLMLIAGAVTFFFSLVGIVLGFRQFAKRRGEYTGRVSRRTVGLSACSTAEEKS